MSSAADHPSPLSVQRAFVVQFRLDADPSQRRWTGRLKHVASGQATWFDTLDELMAFITRVLDQAPKPPIE
ncbi:MAG: hypothetical protein OEU26_26120 [Candidatus Tectomicrobia bacterium]|nr:hypothetical protein [Candidatus Tectomicrobia bacterium]